MILEPRKKNFSFKSIWYVQSCKEDIDKKLVVIKKTQNGRKMADYHKEVKFNFLTFQCFLIAYLTIITELLLRGSKCISEQVF